MKKNLFIHWKTVLKLCTIKKDTDNSQLISPRVHEGFTPQRKEFMSEITSIISLLAKAGAIGAALIVFAIWWIYHKAITEQFKTMLEQQAKREENYFKLLNDSIETNKLMLATLQKMSSSIENNNWCPIAKQFHKGGLNVKSADYAG